VEESAAASEGLRIQATSLVQAVSVFKVADNGGSSASRRQAQLSLASPYA
jgi:hypothetical protein